MSETTALLSQASAARSSQPSRWAGCLIWLADSIFSPFEGLMRPFDRPAQKIPGQGALQLVWHLVKMLHFTMFFGGLLSATAELIALANAWALAFIIDGASGESASTLFRAKGWALAIIALLVVIVDPLVTFIDQSFNAQVLSALLPAKARWELRKTAQQQDLASFEDRLTGQIVERIEQITSSAQSMLISSWAPFRHSLFSLWARLGCSCS